MPTLPELPPAIGNLTGLTVFGFGGNPLTDPPAEVVKQGIAAILKYLREKLASNSKSRTSAGQAGKL